MEKKTMDTLRAMICREIEDIAKKGSLSHETLDILKDLVETEKNLVKIEKYEGEKKEMEMGMDGGYSQRKFYIDADYQPYSQRNSYGYPDMSYARGGQSYARGGQSYADGNSYMNSYMYPMYDMPMYANARGYSRTQSPQEMAQELRTMMQETTDPALKTAISEVISKVEK